VVDVGCGHRKLRGGKERCWTRREETCLTDHMVLFYRCTLKDMTFVPCLLRWGGRD
jgi:hypothetical protein